jgi:hypothetical protein
MAHAHRWYVWVPPVVQRLLLLPCLLGDVNSDEGGGRAWWHDAAAAFAPVWLWLTVLELKPVETMHKPIAAIEYAKGEVIRLIGKKNRALDDLLCQCSTGHVLSHNRAKLVISS